MTRVIRVAAFAALAVMLLGDVAYAEWIRGEVRLNLRIGPGQERKIITTIATGDRVDVLNQTEGWVFVRIPDGREGWIPAGFLTDTAPATVKLVKSRKELSMLRERVDKLAKDTGLLETSSELLKEQNVILSDSNLRLTEDNRALGAGSRWPEFIAGAAILVVGMLLGAIVNSWTDRRSMSRVRL
jgi:uncharacterized protein YgiM (DUF1202 family)